MTLSVGGSQDRHPARQEGSDSIFNFDAFVSYSTSSDYRLVRNIEKFLESFHTIRALRHLSLRRLEICVDGSDFYLSRKPSREVEAAPGGAIRALLQEHLQESRYLLVFCSSTSRNSPWVDAEIEIFLSQRGPDSVLLAITEGQDPSTRPEEVFSSRILEAGLHHKPWYDFRGDRPRQAKAWNKVRDPEEERTRLTAHLYGDTAGRLYPLWQRDRERRQRWRRGVTVGLATMLLALLSWTSWVRTDHFQIRSILRTAPVAEASAADLQGIEALKSWLSALVWTGEQAQALATVESVTGRFRVQALGTVAEALAQVGDVRTASVVFAKALDEALRIEDASEGCEEMVRLARLRRVPALRSKAHGATQAALKRSSAIGPEYQRSRILALVAREMAADGNLKGALSVVGKIQKENQFYQFVARQAIAVDRVEAGQADSALSTALDIQDESVRSLTLSTLAEKLAASKRIEAALEVAHRISDPSYRSTALAAVASELLTRGDSEKAGQLIEQALPLARAMQDDDRPEGRALLAIAVELAEGGDLDTSRAVAREIRNQTVRSSALVTIGRRLAVAGEIEEALATAKEAPESDSRRSAFLQIAGALADRKQVDRASDIFESAMAISGDVTYSQEWDEARARLALAFVRAGHLEPALDHLSRINATNEWPKAQTLLQQTLVEIVKELSSGRNEESLEEFLRAALLRAQEMSKDDKRSTFLAAVAKGFAAASRLRDARLTADRCPMSQDRLEAYATILLQNLKTRNPTLFDRLEEQSTAEP